jgi:hypothetical protein
LFRAFCVCQTRLKLSSKVNECKPLAEGEALAAEGKHAEAIALFEVGRCRLTLSNPRRKRLELTA